MSAIAAAVVGGGALALGAGATAALVAGGVAGAASMYSSSQKQAQAAQASQERAAAGLASSSDYAAKLSYDLGQQRLAFEKQQYEQMLPMARQVSDAQLAAQQEQMRQAREYYDYQTGTFRPLERGLVQQAQTFSTEGYREGLAREAAAAAGRAFATTQGATQRAMAARGVNPASGAAMTAANQNALGLAAQRAGVMTGTRQQAEQFGWARQLDAAGLGRNLPGFSTGAYQGATTAGSAGLASAAAPGTAYGQGLTAASGTMMTGAGQRIQGLGTLYGGQTNLASTALENQYATGGAIFGAAGTLGARYVAGL